jgi:hypothetical protein
MNDHEGTRMFAPQNIPEANNGFIFCKIPIWCIAYMRIMKGKSKDSTFYVSGCSEKWKTKC